MSAHLRNLIVDGTVWIAIVLGTVAAMWCLGKFAGYLRRKIRADRRTHFSSQIGLRR